MFPTAGRPAIEIMMAVWSPGFYRVEDYARRVEDLSAKAADGTELKVEHPEKNRWRVETGGKAKVIVSYRLDLRAVVGDDQLRRRVLRRVQRCGDVHHARRASQAPARSPIRAAAGVETDDDGARARSRSRCLTITGPTTTTPWSIRPIVAGNPSVHEFEVDGSKHLLVDIGETGRLGRRSRRRTSSKKLVRGKPSSLGFPPVQEISVPERLSPGRRRARAQELDVAHRRSAPSGLSRPELPLAFVREPRVFSCVQRQAASARRARAV